MTTTTESGADREFVGYGPAGEYLGISADTLSAYISRGMGPDKSETRPVGQYVRPVFLQSELDAWQASRPGRGTRTDLT